MVGPREGIKFHFRYEIMYFLLFYFFVKRVVGVLGSEGLRFRGLRFRDALIIL